MSNFIDVQQETVGHTKDFLDMGMSGLYYNRGEGAVGNGLIASACSAVLSEVELDGCGVRKTMFGPRFTLNNRKGGFMLMLVRSRGIILGCTQKVSNHLFLRRFIA